MATIYDEFTLQNLAGIPAAINRIGATKAAIAQDAFLTHRATQQAAIERQARQAAAIELFRMEHAMREASAERARKGSVEDTLKIFGIEQQAREEAAQREQRRRWESEAATLGVEPKGLSDAALLRQIKIKNETETDRLSRKELNRKAAALNIPFADDVDEDALRGMITGEEEDRRLAFDVKKIEGEVKARVGALDEERRTRLKKDKPEIDAALAGFETKKQARLKQIGDLSKPVTDKEAYDAVANSPEILAIKATLPKEQQAFLSSGNVEAVAKYLDHFYRDSKAAKTLRSTIEMAKGALQDGRSRQIESIQLEIKQRQSDLTTKLYQDYGIGAFAFDEPSSGAAVPRLPLPPKPDQETSAWLEKTNTFTAAQPAVAAPPSQATPAGWMANKLAVIPSLVGRGMSRQLYGAPPGLASTPTVMPPVDPNIRAAALFRLQSMLQGQSAPQQSGAAVDPNMAAAAMFQLQSLLGQPSVSAPTTISPWQSGANAFRFDPGMFQMPAPLSPSATNIPGDYFSIGR